MDLTVLPVVNDENYTFASFYANTSEGPDVLTSGFEDAFLALPVRARIGIASFDRIDNVAFKAYGNVRYWFLLLLYNGVSNPRVLPSTLNLFGLDDLLYLVAQNATYQAFLPAA
jgi:hypothetical protein